MWKLCVLWLVHAIWEVTPQERVGCYQDREPFILSGIIYRHRSTMTIDWCLNECLIRRRDVFAGLEAGFACLCGNDTDHTKYGQKRPDSECRESCTGNSSQTCGGIGRLEIYRDANECLDDPDLCSMDNLECISTQGSYHCECIPGYINDQGSCSDVNECIEDPDLCSMDNFECINTPGSYRCKCPSGYTLNHGFCLDIDECSHGENKCNQNCNNTNGAYLCSCMRGYELVGNELYNCTDKDECADVNTCDQVCTNLPGGYECSCYDGYRLEYEQGGNCKDVDECTEGMHQCGQTCINIPGLYECVCEKGYHLEQDLHTCSDVQYSGLLKQITGLERLTTGLIVGMSVMSITFTTCLVIMLCFCIRLKRHDKINKHKRTSLQDSPAAMPCYEEVTNNNPREGSAHYEELNELHLKDSTNQTVTPSVQTS